MAVHRRDNHALRKHLGHFVPAGDFQQHTRREGRTAGEGPGLRLAIQVTLVTNAGVKRPGLRRRIAVMGRSRRQVVIRPVIGITVRNGIPAGRVHQSIHVLRGLPVVVVAGADLLLHHAMMALHLPHRVHTLRMLPGRRHRRQRQACFIPLLAVVKLHHVDVQARVGGEAEPDTDLTQQAGDKVQVVLTVLHHLLTPWILSGERKQKILAAHAVALAQDFLHNLRDGHVLVNGVLVRTVKQRQAWLQRQGVAGFVL